MSEVSVTQVQLLPLLSVSVAGQSLLLDPDTAAELFDALAAVFNDEDDDLGQAEQYAEAFEAGEAAATYQRPTVVFRYKDKVRYVVPDTIRMGLDDVLLVGLELSKGGDTHSEPRVKSFSTGQITDLSPGHPVTWPVST